VNSVQADWTDQIQGYREAPTRFFTGQTVSGCGAATSAVGPFYCPGGQTVYIDLDFYDELRRASGRVAGRSPRRT
jgi:predicted metalloprotease